MIIYEYRGELLARINNHDSINYMTPYMSQKSHEIVVPTAWTFEKGKAPYRIGFDDVICNRKVVAYIPVDHFLVRDLVRLAKEEGRLHVKKVA